MTELRVLRDEIMDLEEQKEVLQRDLNRAEEALDSERQAFQELTMVCLHCTPLHIYILTPDE